MTQAHNPFWIQTHTPRGSFDLSNPRAEDVRIEDIAYALSQLCRFTGHCNRFYSVAQHSVHVAEIVAETNPEWALAALLHDAEEAYIGDISSPLKALLRFCSGDALHTPLGMISYNVQHAIDKRFGLMLPTHQATTLRKQCIKAADLKMLATERRDLMPEAPACDWFASTGVAGVTPCDWKVPYKTTRAALNAFFGLFEDLGGKW